MISANITYKDLEREHHEGSTAYNQHVQTCEQARHHLVEVLNEKFVRHPNTDMKCTTTGHFNVANEYATHSFTLLVPIGDTTYRLPCDIAVIKGAYWFVFGDPRRAPIDNDDAILQVVGLAVREAIQHRFRLQILQADKFAP